MINAMELFEFASEDISMDVLFLWILTGFIGKNQSWRLIVPKEKRQESWHTYDANMLSRTSIESCFDFNIKTHILLAISVHHLQAIKTSINKELSICMFYQIHHRQHQREQPLSQGQQHQ